MIGNQARPRRRPDTEEAYLAIFSEAVELVANEFARPLRIEEVARRLATSPRQLQRVFADVGGRGFRSHLIGVRMAHAAELLATTDAPVREVAGRVGYSDASQFCKAFKRSRGESPSQWRARWQATGAEVDALPPAHGP